MNPKESPNSEIEAHEIGVEGELPSELVGAVDSAVPMGGVTGIPESNEELSIPAPDLFASGESLDQPLPGEPSDPIEGLEHLLSGAVADGDLVATSIDPNSLDSALEFRPFEIEVLASLTETQKAQWEKLCAQIGLPEGSWKGPVITRLNEFEALFLFHQGRKLGFSLFPRITELSAHQPSEEELALGELSAVPEREALAVGAPSVELPLGEKNLPVFTASAPPYGKVLETKGLVTAHRSIAKRLFREEELEQKLSQELTRLGRHQGPPSSKIEQTIHDLTRNLRISALALGANAVVGVKLMGFPETEGLEEGNQQLRLVASGTAIVVEK